MRAFSIFTFDIRYQIKYGFYFLYAVISLLYLGILLFLPESMARPAAAIIILTDPAALGFFFIGGMILLERGEGIHTYFSILPTLNREYVLSKVLSLSIISTMVALFIATIMFRSEVNCLLLSLGVFAGASVFTLFGLAVGTVAKSINHYIVISSFIGTLQGVVVGMFWVTVAGNKVEGLALAKLSNIFVMGFIIPWITQSPIRYIFGILPSFWIGEILSNTGIHVFTMLIYGLAGVISCLFLITALTKKFLRRILH